MVSYIRSSLPLLLGRVSFITAAEMYGEGPERDSRSHSQSCDSIHLLRLRIRKPEKWSLNISVELNHQVPLPQWQIPPSDVSAWRCVDCVGHCVHPVLTLQLLCEVIQLCFSQEPPGTEPYPNAFMFCLEIKLLRCDIIQKFMQWSHDWQVPRFVSYAM